MNGKLNLVQKTEQMYMYMYSLTSNQLHVPSMRILCKGLKSCLSAARQNESVFGGDNLEHVAGGQGTIRIG